MFKRKFRTTVAAVIFIIVFFEGPLFQNFIHSVYAFERSVAGLSVLRHTRGYNVWETPNCKIYYTNEDAASVPLISRAVDLYLPPLRQNFALADNIKPAIIVCPDSAYMTRLTKTGEEKPPMGLYYGGVISLLSPRLWAGSTDADIIENFLSDGPVVHELSHYLLDAKAYGNFEIWFTEGVALYYEYKYMGIAWREDLASHAPRLLFEEMSAAFTSTDTALAYRHAFEFIESIVEEIGETGLQDMIARLTQGYKLEATYASVLRKE